MAETSDESDGATCPLCQDERIADTSPCCVGSTPHFLCDTCFCGYASEQFQATGVFEQELVSGGHVSAPGQLPCYLFLTGDCDCPSIPVTAMMRALSSDAGVSERYHFSLRRVMMAEREREDAKVREAEEQRDQEASPVDTLRAMVVEALSRGGYVPCPRCHQHTQKNDACIHMTCPCGMRYCYCCGRRRGDGTQECPSDGHGCDYPSPYLENHPGWDEFALDDETNGMGALQEFHRRRMAYFVMQVKSAQPPSVWNQFRHDTPDMFENVPTTQRRIDWDEIDLATPPLFGSTTVNNLKWADEGFRVMEAITQEQDDSEDQDQGQGHYNQQRDLQEPFDRIVQQEPTPCRLWVIFLWIMFLVVDVFLFMDASDSASVAAMLLAAILAGTGLPTLAMVLVEFFAARSCPIHEVQCFRGRGDELPYLSTAGRWSEWRQPYWYMLFGSLALSFVCMANKEIFVLHVIGVAILTGTCLYYVVCTALVNFEAPPLGEPLRSRCREAVTRLCISGALFSVGVGLLASADTESSAHLAGKVCLVVGFTGGFAEVIPRLRVACQGGGISAPPDKYRLRLSYCFFLGLAVGWLLAVLSDSDGARLVGTGVLLTTFLGSFLAYCLVVHERPILNN